jgi:hypothetical protein
LGKLSSPLKRTRLYSRRADPFAEIWAQAEGMLEKAPELESGLLPDEIGAAQQLAESKDLVEHVHQFLAGI